MILKVRLPHDIIQGGFARPVRRTRHRDLVHTPNARADAADGHKHPLLAPTPMPPIIDGSGSKL